MKSNAELFASTSNATASTDAMEWQEIPEENQENQSFSCLGIDRRLQQPEEQKFKCILCFEDCNVSRDGPCLVYSAFVQRSKVLCKCTPMAIPKEDDESLPSPHTGTCGHVMHASCWKEYYDNEILKENRRPNRNRSPNNFIIDKKEFLCPYCRCLSNAVLPLTAPLSQYSPPLVVHKDETILPFDSWLSVMHSYLNELYIIEQNNDFTEECEDFKAKFPNMSDILSSCGVDETEFRKICQPIDKSQISTEWVLFAQIFMSSVQRVSPYPHAAEDCELFLLAWTSCSYTVQALEMYLRAIEKPFKNEMSIRHKSCLNGLIRVCGMLGAAICQTVADKLMIHLRGLLETVFKQKGPSVVEWDCFTMLSSLVFIFPACMYSYTDSHVVPSGNFLEYYFLKLMFLANIAKSIVLYKRDDTPFMDVDFFDDIDEDDVDDESEEATQDFENNRFIYENIFQFYKKYNLQLKNGDCESIEFTRKCIRKLMEHARQESKTFLRCSCLLFHFITDVDFPDQFSDFYGDTFEAMCKYLGLDSQIELYFDSDGPYLPTIEHFGSHTDILYYDYPTKCKPDGTKFDITPCVTPIRQLIPLPDDYSDLINSVSEFNCPNNEKEEMKTPTMCLICGKVLCGQSYCCQPELEKATVGACTYHSHYCGAGIGMFLRIRDCQILYLGLNKGCFVLPPYLDEYGETDQGLRRGNPLRLCRERYNKLHLSWLGHGLHEEIARLNESMNTVIATQWQHM